MDRGVATGDIRERSSSWWLPVGAGVAVLGLVVVLAKATLGTAAPEVVATSAPPIPSVVVAAVTTTEPVTPPEPAAPEPPPAKDVAISVRTIPPNANIRIDDGAPVEAPYTLATPSSPALRTIRASAPNYISMTRQVAFDQTREIVLELEPVPTQRKKPRAKPAPAREPAPPSLDLRTVTPRVPGVLPSKRPRELDERNPFEG